jgi:hypothetical protein
MQIEINSTFASSSSWTFAKMNAAHSPLPANASRQIAPLTSRAEAYYWTHTWQAGEKETLDALAAGQGQAFDNADEAIRWLLSTDS